MSFNKKIIYFLVPALVVSFMFIMGFYPVAIAGHSVIWRYELAVVERAILYITNAQLLLNGSGPLDLRVPENKTDLRRSALNFLIEDALVKYRGRSWASDLEKKSEVRVYEALKSSPDLSKETKTLYGLGEKDFRKFVLLPQSRKEVVSEYLRPTGRNLEEWLLSIKREAKVIILMPSFHWTGESIE